MGLRELAEADLGPILEDDVTGFAWPITVTDPSGTSAVLKGLSADISQIIDPDTGQAVSGRFVSVVLRLSSLVAAGLGTPRGIADTSGKPWLMQFDDITGAAHTFKVASTDPDLTLGVIVCKLETYTP